MNDGEGVIATHVSNVNQANLEAAIRRQLCLLPVRGVCALGTPSAEGLCVDGSGACHSAHHVRAAIRTTSACVP